jgi:hypothetical protein
MNYLYGLRLTMKNVPYHALRELLELPFEHVIVSNGEPVRTRAAYERALKLTPWSG